MILKNNEKMRIIMIIGCMPLLFILMMSTTSIIGGWISKGSNGSDGNHDSSRSVVVTATSSTAFVSSPPSRFKASSEGWLFQARSLDPSHNSRLSSRLTLRVGMKRKLNDEKNQRNSKHSDNGLDLEHQQQQSQFFPSIAAGKSLGTIFLSMSIFVSTITFTETSTFQSQIAHASTIEHQQITPSASSSSSSSSTTTTTTLQTSSIEEKIMSQQASIKTSSSTKINSTSNKSKYWSLVNSDDPNDVTNANEKLMDYAVGTINTMYYDNSGGAFFSPKDFYDRFKVLRVYAKEGINGVQDLIYTSDVKKVNTSLSSLNHPNNHKKSNDDESNKDMRSETFQPQLFLVQGNQVKVDMNHWRNDSNNNQLFSKNSKNSKNDNNHDGENLSTLPPHIFDSREDIVIGLKWLVSTLDDPYSKYLTREELKQELNLRDDGFLGLGVIVEGPSKSVGHSTTNTVIGSSVTLSSSPATTSTTKATKTLAKKNNGKVTSNTLLTYDQVSNLPIITAIAPNSPAERAGIIVGDRIAAVANDEFVGLQLNEILTKLSLYKGAENYFGNPELRVAKPIYRGLNLDLDENSSKTSSENQGNSNDAGGGRKLNIKNDSDTIRKDEVTGYKLSRVRLSTISLQSGITTRIDRNSNEKSSSASIIPDLVPSVSAASTSSSSDQPIAGGDSIVQWELLKPNDSIFRKYTIESSNSDDDSIFRKSPNAIFRSTDRVGYIRLTRFSRLSTAGFANAVEALETAGAQSYIIDVRNNYGGVIQEAMLTASSLLRDPHNVLCYTLNSRGGFTPHDAEEYIVDTRYPGYLLSSEPKGVTMEQVKRESPNFVSGEGWVPPSAYASIREQRLNRHISKTSFNLFGDDFRNNQKPLGELKQLIAQKKVVILMNEGTASAAEVFVSSLHDNGRTVATVGTKTYGKGLIQHTFPLQDGGGLRLSVAEYLTPALQHVTKVGGAQYDRITGEFVGGGVKPDIFCPSTQGIPSNVGADICVGMAVDAIDEADTREMEISSSNAQFMVERRGGSDGNGAARRTLTQGINPDGF